MDFSELDRGSRQSHLRAVRIEKLNQLQAQGINPYPATVKTSGTIRHAKSGAIDRDVQIAGRIVSWRSHGRTIFAHLDDGTARIQLYFRKDGIGEIPFKSLDLLDLGDFIAVQGSLFKTRTGELTLKVNAYQVLSKCLRPLPDKWHGLKDVETRFRKRYLDLLINPSTKALIETRGTLLQNIRRYLHEAGFTEVFTPVLEAVPGGADAEPFITHHKALDTDFFLRISLELHLKRLIIGGVSKIYEIGRVFRNEGLSREHLQEFDMLEFYWAYADHDMLKGFVQDFYCAVIEQTIGRLQLPYDDVVLDFSPPWPVVDYFELFENTGIDLEKYPTFESLAGAAREIGLEIEDHLGRGRLIDKIYKRKIRPNLIQPQFLTGHPIEVSPLAKRNPDHPQRALRLQVLVAGSEVGNGWAELNDPRDQRNRFMEQMRLREAGDLEAQRIDEDFLEALEYGMPPTAGFGVSIDRWLMFLTNVPNIREVVAFPPVKPASK